MSPAFEPCDARRPRNEVWFAQGRGPRASQYPADGHEGGCVGANKCRRRSVGVLVDILDHFRKDVSRSRVKFFDGLAGR